MTVQNDAQSGDIRTLLDIMARLRNPETGCPWDIEQSFQTIAPYTIEEAYEVEDAITQGDMAALKDELGDLLFQVVFHARIAQDAGHFAFGDVVNSICNKMIRRHPHVFDEGEKPDWEALKAGERMQDDDQSSMAGVARGLPALMRAEKLQKRAARVGFDWPDPSGSRAKISEELAEVEAAMTDDAREDEIGDLLFATVNWSRQLGIDPETALRRASRKFETRFRAMEDVAGEAFASLSLTDKEALWQQVKRLERTKTG
jgi:nucleoside triphosphate diphosphatase